MTYQIQFLLISTLLLQLACVEPPKTAEEVLELYVSSINQCDCDVALELSIDEAKDGLLYLVESGCIKNQDEIVSVTCNEGKNSAQCNVRIRKTASPNGLQLGKYTYNFGYFMKRVDGEWKVAASLKGLTWPEEYFNTFIGRTDSVENYSSFDAFYTHFIADSLFQISHIQFPLEGNYSDHDGQISWQRDEWPLIKWDYKAELKMSNDSITILETDTTFYISSLCEDCGFSFWMKFKKIAGNWQMIGRQENNY